MTDIVKTGDDARELLKNEQLKKTFDEIEIELFNDWKNSTKIEDREAAYSTAVALRKFQDTLVGKINRGIMEDKKRRRKNT